MSARPFHATVATTALALAALAGCDATTSTGARPRAAEETAAPALGHVHGLGTDPADGTLYAASHFGVFRLPTEGAAVRVAGRWQDTMAFTVVGPRHFLASGHPDQREDLPVHLGLMESTDAADTWRPVSLHGRADFHALEVAGDRIYGYDALTGRLLVTSDRRTWRPVAKAELVDLAADPREPDRVLATAPDGTVVAYHGSETATRTLDGSPPLVLLDWPVADLLVGMGADGAVYRSFDGAASWVRAGALPGEAQALDVTRDAWHAATSHGIFRSTDSGRTWQPLTGQGH